MHFLSQIIFFSLRDSSEVLPGNYSTVPLNFIYLTYNHSRKILHAHVTYFEVIFSRSFSFRYALGKTVLKKMTEVISVFVTERKQ